MCPIPRELEPRRRTKATNTESSEATFISVLPHPEKETYHGGCLTGVLSSRKLELNFGFRFGLCFGGLRDLGSRVLISR